MQQQPRKATSQTYVSGTGISSCSMWWIVMLGVRGGALNLCSRQSLPPLRSMASLLVRAHCCCLSSKLLHFPIHPYIYLLCHVERSLWVVWGPQHGVGDRANLLSLQPRISLNLLSVCGRMADRNNSHPERGDTQEFDVTSEQLNYIIFRYLAEQGTIACGSLTDGY